MKMKNTIKSTINDLDTMNIRNVNGSLNKEGSIENTVEVNIYYQGIGKERR